MKEKIFRQGDVLIKRVKAIPKNAKKKEGRTIAYGELTNHHHSFKPGSKLELLECEGQTFIDVQEASVLEHQEHNAILVCPGVYQLIIERELNAFSGVIQQVRD